jgi:hypothetical protein
MDMNDQLENDLRELFVSRASAVPADATMRLGGVSFHPRTGRRWSPKVTVGSLAGLAATTGTVVSVIVLGGAQPAFAGWTAAPTVVSLDQSTTASQKCQSQIRQSSGGAGTSSADWTPVDTDTRGPYTVIVYQDGSADATCFNGPSFTVINSESVANGDGQQAQSNSVSVNKGSGGSSGSVSGGGVGPSSVSVDTLIGGNSNAVTQMTVSHLDLDSASGGPYTLVEGQIAPGVTGVTLMRNDGEGIQATTGSGWLVAWWPGSEGISSAEVTTSSGQTSESFDTTTLPSPSGGAQSCNSSSGANVSSGASPTGQESNACSDGSPTSGSSLVAP